MRELVTRRVFDRISGKETNVASLFEGFSKMALIRLRPPDVERPAHEDVVSRLRCFRETLERDTEPEPWTALEGPAVLFLADVCEALTLAVEERADVLGRDGERALAGELQPPIVVKATVGNERQAAALEYAREHGAIRLADYRELCPYWSDETLRVDLAGLVARGLLVKNGAKRGMVYLVPEQESGHAART